MRNILLGVDKNMKSDQKALGILAILLLIAIATLLISCPITSGNEQPVFEYTVQADDTCTKIAVNFGVSVISIVEANNLKKNCGNIYTGEVLLIPYPMPTPLGSPVATFRNIVIDCFEREKYTVKDGDTLDSIANKYKTSKEVIANHNGIYKEVKTGMQLVIPLCYTTPDP